MRVQQHYFVVKSAHSKMEYIMPKWFENWLKSRREAQTLIAKLSLWQIQRKANKDVKYARNAAKRAKHRR